MKVKVFFLISMLALSFGNISAQSISDQQGINYQAVLAENGNALQNTSINVRFSIQKEDRTVFQEEQMVITDDLGQFSAIIGEGSPIMGSMEMIDWGSASHTLKVELDTGNGFAEISNQPFQSVPYSLFAEKVRTLPVITMDSLTDVVAPRPAVGEILKWDGKAWIPGNDNVASGSDAAVNTSSRIEGDGSTNDPLDLAQQGAVEGQVLKWDGTSWKPADEGSGTETSIIAGKGIQIINDTLFNTGDIDPSDDLVQGSPAGGDLEGEFPNPRVTALQGRSLSEVEPNIGQVLKWNGTTWKASEDESGASLWSEPDSGEVSFTGKIGLNVANPFLDIQSNGFFSHEGFFQVANSGVPTMRIRHNKQDNVFPQAVQLQFTVLGEPGQGLLLYETQGFNFRTFDDNNNRFDTYIRNNGRMGLGVSSPREKLDIDGAIKLGNTNAENNGTIRYNGSDFEGRKEGEWVSLTQQGSNSGSTSWDSSKDVEGIFFSKGNVGIGLESPQDLLHIHNTDPLFSSRSITRYTNDFTGEAETGLEVGIQTNNGITDGIMRNQAKDGRLVFGTDNTTRMVINHQGRVGIGTINPVRLLSLGVENANSTTGQFLITQAGSGDAFMNFLLDGGASYALGIDNSDGDKFKIGYNNDSPSGVGNNTLVEMDADGNMEVKGEIRRAATGNANMVPIAYGNITADGSINKSSGNISVIRKSSGNYEISINGEDISSVVDYIISVTLAFDAGFPVYSSIGGKLLIETFRFIGGVEPDDRSFSFVVYKP